MIGYYRSRDGQVDGPFFEGQLISMWSAGQLVMTDQLCMQESEDWLPADQVMDGITQSAEELQVVPRVAPQKVAIKKKQKNTNIPTIVVLLALLLILPLMWKIIVGGESGLKPWERHYYSARATIKERLKSPSTAKFASISDTNSGASELGNDIWRATGNVDSQNGFGAMIRNDWEVIWNVKTRAILYTQIGDQTSGNRAAVLKKAREVK